MNIQDKLAVLSSGAKYDVSCSSSGSRRKNQGGLGNAHYSGICHSWTADGRCVSLLKILQSNTCAYNCSYCLNRRDQEIPRASFTPHELADLTMNFYRRNYIEGLFLSSAVIESPDRTMELMLQTVALLRRTYNFHGYIHLKAIPGADPLLLEAAGSLADRVSVNLEMAGENSLALLAPDKNHPAILKPMAYLHHRAMEQGWKKDGRSRFLPAGQTSQLIVGLGGENDRQIIKAAGGLYQDYQLKRVYYSAYMPMNRHTSLPDLPAPLWREHRLYQADWLLRFYGFKVEELLGQEEDNFSEGYDPKVGWALRNLDLFPLEINTAEYNLLLRVPGIGNVSAKRITAARRHGRLTYDNLAKLGLVLKRAIYFITINGRYYGGIPQTEEAFKSRLINPAGVKISPRQISIFDYQVTQPPAVLEVRS
ncbi:MAG: putative DNA modification/repair radical SAM protein [Clostridiales bacterium]|jgi:putative DNA modification/repair radical SAM protein|nr:putative DNA modification/repair radical SAM protein [Clostridiales bacterium]